jgi:hypothetical protein
MFVFLRIAVGHSPGGNICLKANDWFDAFFFGSGIEIDYTEHRTVVGDGAGRHTEFLNPPDQFPDVTKTVKKGIFGVNMQVGK